MWKCVKVIYESDGENEIIKEIPFSLSVGESTIKDGVEMKVLHF